ncbi:MAG: GNAT family N-acetyltransferase [Vulcanimicrobiaceae bacterium]
MDFSIVRATSSHAAHVAPLFDAYRQFFTEKSDLQRSTEFISERLHNQDSVVFLALDGDEGVGFIQLYPLFSSWYAKRIWFLSDLYVTPDARRNAVGRALVQRVVDHANETGASSVMVELPFSEPHLQRFYGAFGFEKDEVFDLYRLKTAGSKAHR